MNYLDGKAINFIEYYKSPIETVENTERIILHISGGVMIISNTDEIHQILKWMKEAKNKKYDVNEYVRFRLIED